MLSNDAELRDRTGLEIEGLGQPSLFRKAKKAPERRRKSREEKVKRVNRE
jgi:hypothetical protein